jgi:hypothetical protein
MAISRVAGQMLKDVLERDGVNISFANANVGINTASPGSAFEVAGDLTVGNVVISNIGNINAGNVNINFLEEPVANSDAATKGYVLSQISGNVTSIGNLVVNDTTITTSTANANISIDPNGTGTFVIVGTNGFVMPIGNTSQRPIPAYTGTLRFNSDYARIEYYDGTEWDVVAGGITNETFNGDGSTVNFNLARQTNAPSILVMLNGIVQLPVSSYTITGVGSNVLTFNEAPAVSDIIDVRFL